MFSISVSLQSVVCFRAAVGVFSPVLVLFSIAIHSFVSRAAVGDFLLSYLFLFLATVVKKIQVPIMTFNWLVAFCANQQPEVLSLLI